MAEIFGTVAGALSVAALFNNCVDCFEYIQLGRHFAQDFGRYQLRLDIAKTRMQRWGQAVKVNEDPRFATNTPNEATAQQTRAILEEIELLFRSVKKSSERYKSNAAQEDLTLLGDQDMQPVALRLHRARLKQKQASLFKKATWALYDGENFEKLIREITKFIGALEMLISVEMGRRRIVELEIEDVDDEPSLLALQDAASSTDQVLYEAVAQRIKGIAGRNSAKDIKSKEKAKVRVGNEWGKDILKGQGPSNADGTVNTVEFVDAEGTSAVHVGNNFGGRGIFED